MKDPVKAAAMAPLQGKSLAELTTIARQGVDLLQKNNRTQYTYYGANREPHDLRIDEFYNRD